MSTTNLDRTLTRTLRKLSGQHLLTPHLEKAISRGDFPDEYPVKVQNKEWTLGRHFHPSSHTLSDPLWLYYLFKEDLPSEEEKFTPESWMNMQVGSAMHAVFQNLMIHLGFTTLEECEVPFKSEERWCSGNIDIRRCQLPDGVVLPVEIKSSGFVPQKPFSDHIAQLQVYMDLGCDQAERGLILYLEKASGHRIVEFIVERDEALLNEIYDRWARAQKAIETDDPSELENCCEKDSERHKKCDHRFICRIGQPTSTKLVNIS